MTNAQIKRAGHLAVIRHERGQGRKAVLHETGEGFDILSGIGAGVRHIEVKGTTRARPHFRHLTRNEAKAWRTDKRWYLYCVCNIGKRARVRIREFSRHDLRGRVKTSTSYTISFKKEDFA